MQRTLSESKCDDDASTPFMSIASKVLLKKIKRNFLMKKTEFKFSCLIFQRRIGSTGAAERRATGFKGREGGTKMIEIR